MNVTSTVQQLNKTAVGYFYDGAVELFGTFDKDTGRRLTSRVAPCGQLKTIAEIFSFSRADDDGVRGTCTRTLEQFSRDLGSSESTIRRSLKVGTVKNLITSDQKGEYQFDTENNFVCGGFYKLEAWMTRPIKLENRTIELSNVKQWCLAYFNSECNRAPQELSANDLARVLDISIPAASEAINLFTDENVQLLYCTRKGVNGHKKSMYIINKKLFRELNKRERKEQKLKNKAQADKEAKAAEEQQDVTALKEAIEREIYNRKHKRADLAERALSRAMADEAFRTSSEELNKLVPKLSLAEARNLPELAELQRKSNELKAHRMAALKRLKIDEAEFSEDFYRCPDCQDKLFLPNGKRCKCFSCGAPPGEA